MIGSDRSGAATLRLIIKQEKPPLSEQPYLVDLGSVRRAFPLHIEPPHLLLDFAAWLDGRLWGSIGCFDLVGQFSEQAPIVDGSLLRNDLALFLHLPDGSAVGSWCLPAIGPEDAPIVVLGSEGQREILASSLAGLLAKIALQRFEEEGEWSDFTPHEDSEDATGELADWLRERFGSEDLERIAELPTGLPDFAGWLGKWCSDREEYWAAHPVMAELARCLTAHRPTSKNPWDSTHFEIAIVGAQYQARVLRRGRQPIDEAAAIEPLLRRLRDDMCRTQPDLGLWYSMTFALMPNGCILPNFDYETRPMFGETAADLAQARADLARAPRPERWTPTWPAKP
jgi:hypothetical protein